MVSKNYLIKKCFTKIIKGTLLDTLTAKLNSVANSMKDWVRPLRSLLRRERSLNPCRNGEATLSTTTRQT